MWRKGRLAVDGDNISFIHGVPSCVFLSSVSSTCKWYSVEVNEAPISAEPRTSLDITALLIYCQPLIGAAPTLILLLHRVCCASCIPESQAAEDPCFCHVLRDVNRK